MSIDYFRDRATRLHEEGVALRRQRRERRQQQLAELSAYTHQLADLLMPADESWLRLRPALLDANPEWRDQERLP